jgi:osmotically inducible protein OsmC
MKNLYSTTVQVTGGRNGRAVSRDGLLDTDLAFPKELGGSGKDLNPELMFAAGFGACFNASVRNVAKGRNLDAGDVTVDATVTLFVKDDGAYGVSVILDVATPGLSAADRDSIVTEASRICAYSNATRGSTDVTVTHR